MTLEQKIRACHNEEDLYNVRVEMNKYRAENNTEEGRNEIKRLQQILVPVSQRLAQAMRTQNRLQ